MGKDGAPVQIKTPKITSNDFPMGTMLSLKLAKAGYGTPADILSWGTTMVLDALEYEDFCNDYQTVVTEMNRDS